MDILWIYVNFIENPLTPPRFMTASFSSSLSRRRPGGFTLIELLVVITIIAILVGMVFAAGPALMRNAKKTSTRTDMKNLEIAINDYYTEYNRYPVPTDQTGDMFLGEGGGSTSDLMNVLLAEPEGWNADNKLNPKKKSFFKPRIAKGGSGPPRAGLADDGKYYDSYGGEYRILIDADYDEIIDADEVDEFDYTDKPAAESGKFEYMGGVMIQSLGSDKEHGKKGNKVYRGSDDSATWLQ
jgi:prepilin-type N-terminal cleavage/methylation domain-containing protein